MKKRKTWRCEAPKNIYVNVVWLIDHPSRVGGAPHEWLALRASQSDYEARRKTPKILHSAGESFLDGIWVAHKRLQEHSPGPPCFEGTYIKSEKRPVLTDFSVDF